MTGLRVLQAMAGARHGGAEAFFTRLVAALGRAGLTQRVLIRRDRARAAGLREAGIEPVELAFGGWFDVVTRVALAREIRRFRPLVVLTWMSRASAMVPSRRFTGGGYIHVGRLGGYYDLGYYRACDHLVANTRAIVDHIVKRGWPEARAHYLPNFVDAHSVAPVDRASLDTPANAPLAVALGRLHPNKAFDVLLEALAKAPGVFLWLAGEGEARAALEAQAKRLGISARVRFLGWREDAGALIAAADFLVCPSRREPLGNVVLEAWAGHRPAIAAAAAGPAALIEHEESGLIVPVEDAGALAQGIARLAGDRALRGRLAEGGHRVFEAEFTEPMVVQRYLAFFDQVARECAASPA
ncbi:MAG: glycosyltransferase [Pseudomonadota bacterium]